MTYGQACLATGRFDTQVPWEAVEVVATALRDAKDPEGLERLRDAVRDADYGRTLDACLAGYLARDPGQAGAHAALRTAIAYRLGRLEEAGTWLAKTAPADLTSTLASTWGVTWDTLQEEVRQAVSQEPSRF